MSMVGVLDGRVIATTRETPGTLDDALAAHGARVVHVPLISTVDIPADAPDRPYQWLIVTSRHGAERAGAWWQPGVRTAAVGTETAAVLSDTIGVVVDVVPQVQTAVELVAALPEPVPGAASALVVQGDLASMEVRDRLRMRGYEADARVVYGTRAVVPSMDSLSELLACDAITLASGSAARALAAVTPDRVAPQLVAIGPSTAAVAVGVGLDVAAVADPHSVDGLVAAACALFGSVSDDH